MAAALLLQLGYAAYTGRHVEAAHFGAYAMALALSVPGTCLVYGLVQLTLTSTQPNRVSFSAAARLAVVSGVLLFAASQAVAPLWGLVWDAPQLVELLRTLAFHGLLSPFVVVCTTTLRAQLRNRTAVLLELGGQAVGLTTGVALLAAGWNPMGLAAMWVAADILPGIVGCTLLMRSLQPGDRTNEATRCWKRVFSTEFRGCLRYAVMHVLTVSFAMWAAAWALGAVATGHYSRAYYFVAMIAQILTPSIVRTTTPALLRVVAEDGGKLGPLLKDVLCVASALVAACFGLLAAVGPTALPLLLGSSWEFAGSLVPWFIPGFAGLVLCTLGYNADQVRHATTWVFSVQWAAAATTAAVVASAAVLRNPQLLALSLAFATVTGHGMQLWRWHRDQVMDVLGLLSVYLVHAGVGVAVFAAGTAGGHMVGGPDILVLMAVLGSVLPVLWGCWINRRRIPVLRTAAAYGLLSWWSPRREDTAAVINR